MCVTKDLSWRDAGLNLQTYLTDALEKVPWIGDWLCGYAVPFEQITCWGTFCRPHPRPRVELIGMLQSKSGEGELWNTLLSSHCLIYRACLCSGIDRDGVVSNKRRCPPPLGQNIGEEYVGNIFLRNRDGRIQWEMHLTCIFHLFFLGKVTELRCLYWCEPEQKQPSSWWDVLSCEFLVP